MTVKELKEAIQNIDDDLYVMIPTTDNAMGYLPLNHISVGVNEADGCVFLDCVFEEDE